MADFRPIPGDEHHPVVIEALGSIGTEHLLPTTVSTFAAEAMQDDGTHHQWAVIIEFEGRFNRTDQNGTQKVVLDYEAAMILLGNLHHSLVALTAAGGGPSPAGT